MLSPKREGQPSFELKSDFFGINGTAVDTLLVLSQSRHSGRLNRSWYHYGCRIMYCYWDEGDEHGLETLFWLCNLNPTNITSFVSYIRLFVKEGQGILYSHKPMKYTTNSLWFHISSQWTKTLFADMNFANTASSKDLWFRIWKVPKLSGPFQ